MSISTPTLQQLQRGLEISEKIAALEAELSSLFGGSSSAVKAKAAPAKVNRRKFKRSPETIAKMRAAQQARWAKIKGKPSKAPAAKATSAKAPAPKPAAKKKRSMSPETKAKLAAAMKARWAARKAK